VTGSPFQYRAAAANGVVLEMFGKNGAAVDVNLSHRGSNTQLAFELPGAASTREVHGARATARVGDVEVRWTSYADRLKEDVVLAHRPADDQIVFMLHQRGLTFTPDRHGGYLAKDAKGLIRFHVVAPTVKDAAGRSGRATLELPAQSATLRIDPNFLRDAKYPVTIDPTIVYPNEVQTDNPTAYWRLGESSGSTAYDSAGGLDGTYVNSPVLGQPGALAGDLDTAVRFNGPGSNDYVEVPDAPFLRFTTSFTIEAWIYQDSFQSAGYRLVDKETAGIGDGYNFDTLGVGDSFTGSGHRLRLCGNEQCPYGNTDYSLNEWHHVAVTVSGTTATFYLDGQMDGSGLVGSIPIQQNTLPLRIGAANVGCGGGCGLYEYFSGLIDEVAVYDHALPGERIVAHKDAGEPECNSDEPDSEECKDPGPFQAPNPPERCLNHDPIASRPPGGTGDAYDRLLGQGVYVLRDPTTRDIRYVGRGDVPRRLAEHRLDPEKANLDQVVVANNNLCYEEARGLEQRLQDEYKGRNILKRLIPALLNRIRGISLKNRSIQMYLAAAERLVAEAINTIDTAP